MEEELFVLINRTELAAERAEKSAFYDTAQALRSIAAGLKSLDQDTIGTSQLQFSH
jgi:hypothetical protein